MFDKIKNLKIPLEWITVLINISLLVIFFSFVGNVRIIFFENITNNKTFATIIGAITVSFIGSIVYKKQKTKESAIRKYIEKGLDELADYCNCLSDSLVGNRCGLINFLLEVDLYNNAIDKRDLDLINLYEDRLKLKSFSSLSLHMPRSIYRLIDIIGNKDVINKIQGILVASLVQNNFYDYKKGEIIKSLKDHSKIVYSKENINNFDKITSEVCEKIDMIVILLENIIEFIDKKDLKNGKDFRSLKIDNDIIILCEEFAKNFDKKFPSSKKK